MELPTGKHFDIRMQATEIQSMLDHLEEKSLVIVRKRCICSKIRLINFLICKSCKILHFYAWDIEKSIMTIRIFAELFFRYSKAPRHSF